MQLSATFQFIRTLSHFTFRFYPNQWDPRPLDAVFATFDPNPNELCVLTLTRPPVLALSSAVVTLPSFIEQFGALRFSGFASGSAFDPG